MKFIAGLVVASEDAEGPFILLQRRGEWDYERNRAESYPGGCQVTASGGMEDDDEESEYRAMLREVRQELGEDFAAIAMLAGIMSLLVWRCDEMQREVSFYWVRVPSEALGAIRLHPSSGGLVRFRPGMPLKNLYTRFRREDGVTDRTVIAVFPEAEAAIMKIFSLLKEKKK